MTNDNFDDLGYIRGAIHFLSFAEGFLGLAKTEVSTQDDVAHLDVIRREISRLQDRLREIDERTNT